MPVQTFNSLEAHLAAVQNANNAHATLMGKVTRPWTMSGLMLPRLRAQWGQAGAGNIIEATVISRGVSIFMPTQNAHVVQVNGHRFDSQTLRLQLPREEFCIASTDWHGWFSMFIPDEVIALWNATEATPIGASSGFIQLSAERAEAFQRAIVQLGLIVHRAPEGFESLAAVSATTHKLTALVREALSCKVLATPKLGRPSVSRKEIVRSVMNSVEELACEDISVAELSTTTGVSERTLRAAFQEYFGMGPVRYLKLRMLNLVRKALQDADSSVTTVTQIATQFGVWELGRFAQDYRALFSELPSETLRRSRTSGRL